MCILTLIYRYLRLPIKEVTGPIIDSSVARHEVFDRLGKPKSEKDAINMLGDQSAKIHNVFCENGGFQMVKTIAVGMESMTIFQSRPFDQCNCFSFRYI